ncbi:hypothetical protein M758_UG096000 [Ceratodon purpureus]|nr:hypothetical protein M758_UG096000 [Ceratodon purpureus]
MQIAIPRYVPDAPTSPPNRGKLHTVNGPSELGVAADLPVPESVTPPLHNRGHETDNVDSTAAPTPPERETREPSARARTSNDLARVLPGLYVIKEGILPLLSSHCFSLRETRHTAAAEVHRAKDRQQEEVQRLRFVERKVAEKVAIHERALEEYEEAVHVLNAAREDRAAPVTMEEKLKKKNYLKNCEALVEFWAENLGIARERLTAWQFKNTRQIAIVGKLTDEAHTTEVNYMRTSNMIDVDIANLQAVSELLQRAPA